MSIPTFDTLTFEEKFIFERFIRTVKQDLQLRRSGHSGKIPANDHIFFTEFSCLKPVLRNCPAFIAWVDACEQALENPEPEILALIENKAIILNEDENQDEAFLRWFRANPQLAREHTSVARYGDLTQIEKTAKTMALLKQEIMFIPSTWRPAWQLAQEEFINWLSDYIAGDVQTSEPASQDPEEPKRKGRPTGSFKKVLQDSVTALAGLAVPILGGLK
jgi:hypothetical protein